jgi:hypothetical protein
MADERFKNAVQHEVSHFIVSLQCEFDVEGITIIEHPSNNHSGNNYSGNMSVVIFREIKKRER